MGQRTDPLFGAKPEYPMKIHKNQWFLALLSLPAISCGGTNQGTYPGAWGADAVAVPWGYPFNARHFGVGQV